MTADGPLPAFLLNACRRAFADRPDMAITDLRPISDGWECEVWSFDLETREDGRLRRQGLILRIYPGEAGPAKAAREFAAMGQLHRQGYPVPQVFALDRNDSIWLSFRLGPEALGMRPEATRLMAQSSYHLRTAYALLRERTGLRLPAVEALIS